MTTSFRTGKNRRKKNDFPLSGINLNNEKSALTIVDVNVNAVHVKGCRGGGRSRPNDQLHTI
jgi:hypothetical protein